MLKDFGKVNIWFNEFEGFDPIDEANVELQIDDVNFSKIDNKVLEFRFKILSGSKKGGNVYDYVSYIPYQTLSFKMPKLMKGIGVDEGTHDFNDWIGKKCLVNLVRGFSKKEPDRVYQNIEYHEFGVVASVTTTVVPDTKPVVVKVNEPLPSVIVVDKAGDFSGIAITDEDIDDIDVPF